MNVAAKHSIAFRLGRALGGVARFCMHDRNMVLRWIKRVIFVGPLLFLVVSNVSWVLSTVLTTILLVVAIYVFSKMDFFAGNASEDHNDDDELRRAPFYGEYEHPDYHMYYDD